MPRKKRLVGVAALGLTLALAGAACGDSGSSDAASNAFCSKGPAVDELLRADEPDQAAVSDALAEAKAAAPDKLKDAVNKAADDLEKQFSEQDAPPFADDDTLAAQNKIYDYYVSDCGYQRMSVTAKDYKFDGVDKTVKSGPTVLRLENKGTEVHEAIVVRVNDGVTESVDELLQDPDAAQSKVTTVGAAFVKPGSTAGSTIAIDKPGKYVMLCFIPLGTTPEALQKAIESGTEPDGPPHFTQGMKAEFTVS
jgi:uncharacterized cupredoxin-like copper-binding protein